ncbi:probable apyrase 7 isoform X2 [Physcomitrium patens]|uniref:probable apyrase 7 isoform X2 n=1 Tax=Physcomitrium patens TaxID=3218 RepID=UPI000D160BF7|nr:probable apyrase 7 isoform X2 [Physcomitrium patens]|eukprot:XP_024402467.1 probable apyrase 7 isoform X2 [Physcomitrella patens]
MGIGGGNSGSVPPALSQPPRCPVPVNISSVSPLQYGRDAVSLRNSLSVPAFSTYLKVDPPVESSGNGASTVPVAPNLTPLQTREGFPPRVPKSSKTGATGGLPSSPNWWFPVKAATGFLCAAVLLLYFGFLLGQSYWKTDALQYAIVIDGGSTGTRVHVYAWAHSPKDSLPVMVKPTYSRDDSAPWYRVPGQQRAYKRVETEPGLDKTLNDEIAVQHALQPLLDWAEKQIPPYARGSTRLFLLATAGLRRLPRTQSDSILDSAFSVLQRSPFMCQRKWVKVISGVEEAYYGWIALNYNLGRLGHTSKVPSVGTLDLGGSSFQVTFEPEGVTQAYGVNISVGTTDHNLYAVSHAGYGLNDAFEKSVAQLLRPQASGYSAVVAATNGLVELEHPCLHKGYRRPYVCSTHCMLPPLAFGSQSDGLRDRVAQVELVGGANWKACQALVEKVVNSSHMEICPSASCALGKYQPSSEGNFYGLAGFFVVYKFFGLKGNAPLGRLLKKGQKYCELNWKEVQAKVGAQPSIDQYCFRAPYVAALLRQGLHLRDDQVTIGSGDFAWTLGAALWEAGALIPVQTEAEKIVQASFSNTRIAVSVALLLLLFLILGIITRHLLRILRPRRRSYSYLPRFNSLTSAPGGPHWIQLPLRTHGRLGGLTVNGFGRGDDGVKMPHSPVPDVHGLHNPAFGSVAFNGSIIDREGVQLSITGIGATAPDRHQKSTGKVQHKGGYLQSRRTQSREDLSYCVSDLHGARV